MAGGQRGDLGVVGVYQREARRLHDAEHVDGGDARRQDRVGDLPVLHPGDDPVAVPVVQPGRDQFLQASGLEERAPAAVGPDKSRDPAKDLAPGASEVSTISATCG